MSIHLATVIPFWGLNRLMVLSRRTPLPLPVAELERLRGQLDPQYGFERWESILAVRVPRDEPDVVNDVEEAAETVGPADVEGATVLLVGNRKDLVIPSSALADAVALRVQLDAAIAQETRRALPPGGHRALTWPGDARRRPRLVIRLPGSVAEVEDEGFDALAATLAPLAEEPSYRDVHAVHLVGDRDEARLEGGLFWEDLLRQHQEASERHELAQELAAKVHAPAAPAPADALLAALEARLQQLGYVVRLKPSAKVPVDLAAERKAAPHRVVAFLAPLLDGDTAQAALEATRALQADLGLVVARQVDKEGERKLVATRVRAIAPDAISTLHL